MEIINELKTAQTDDLKSAPFCSLTNFYCLNIQWGFSLRLKDLWRWYLHRMDKGSRPFKHVDNCPANPPFHRDINAWILKQLKIINELKTTQTDHFQVGPFCSLTNFYCFNIQWGFSLRLKDLWRWHLHRTDTGSHPFKRVDSWPANPPFNRDINAWILKQ